MRSHMGRASLFAGVLSWASLLLALVFGGLDPAPAETPLLRAIVLSALCAAVFALPLAVVALVRGPQRVAAAFGLVLALLFLLYFTGFGFALVTLVR